MHPVLEGLTQEFEKQAVGGFIRAGIKGFRMGYQKSPGILRGVQSGWRETGKQLTQFQKKVTKGTHSGWTGEYIPPKVQRARAAAKKAKRQPGEWAKTTTKGKKSTSAKGKTTPKPEVAPEQTAQKSTMDRSKSSFMGRLGFGAGVLGTGAVGGYMLGRSPEARAAQKREPYAGYYRS